MRRCRCRWPVSKRQCRACKLYDLQVPCGKRSRSMAVSARARRCAAAGEPEGAAAAARTEGRSDHRAARLEGASAMVCMPASNSPSSIPMVLPYPCKFPAMLSLSVVAKDIRDRCVIFGRQNLSMFSLQQLSHRWRAMRGSWPASTGRMSLARMASHACSCK